MPGLASGVDGDGATGKAVGEGVEQLTLGRHMLFVWFVAILEGTLSHP